MAARTKGGQRAPCTSPFQQNPQVRGHSDAADKRSVKPYAGSSTSRLPGVSGTRVSDPSIEHRFPPPLSDGGREGRGVLPGGDVWAWRIRAKSISDTTISLISTAATRCEPGPKIERNLKWTPRKSDR